MKDLPRLSGEALQHIESTEKDAKRDLADHVRVYTPGNPRFRFAKDNLVEGGCRSIDYCCVYAERLFDAEAEEYCRLLLPPEFYGKILRKWIMPRVVMKAFVSWKAWLAANHVVSRKYDKKTDRKKGLIEMWSRPNLAATDVNTIVSSFRAEMLQPEFKSMVEELSTRFGIQITDCLRKRLAHWESKAKPAKVVPEAPISSVRVRPGPKPNVDQARQVFEVVQSVAGEQDWKTNLDEICDAMDTAHIPVPRTWRNRHPCIQDWTDAASTSAGLAQTGPAV